MSDPELEAIRAQRMAQLQQQMGGAGGGDSMEQQRQQQERQQQMEDMKQTILAQVLSQEAKARLSAIALAKPEKARMVEGMLVQMAQTGQIGGKLSENQLKDLLERINQQSSSKATGVKFDRRRAAFDSDDDDY